MGEVVEQLVADLMVRPRDAAARPDPMTRSFACGARPSMVGKPSSHQDASRCWSVAAPDADPQTALNQAR